ncbi:hypothetical protein JD844_015422 [Phrynosoma platyrhinos]|uniref:Zinc finger CCCH domain-containing protein 3 n=1 Tax=Phrynosoma platyrhinos TaxID=52577 RepID=A0ABQ7SJD8_PHRPL|nr:hypothetical protein JD844_015422 [Phrynosoma platyrhinos]
MEEKEQLRRQIRLLQGLINDHKNVHGNAPVPPPATQWRNPRPSFTNQGGFSARYSQQTQRDFPPCQTTASAWRNKYSLVNIPPRPTLSSGSSVSASSASRTTLSNASSDSSEPQWMLSERNRGPGIDGNIVQVQGALAAVSTTVPKSQSGSSAALGATAASQRCVSSSTSSSKSGSKESKELPYLLDSKTVAGSRDGGDAPTVCQKVSVTTKAVQGVSQCAPSLCRTISKNAVTLKSEPQQPLTAPDHGLGCLPKRKTPASQVPSLHSSQQLPVGKGKPNPSIVCTKSTWEASMVGKTLSEKKHIVPAVQKPPALPSAIKSPRFKKANYTWVANPSKSSRTVKKASENVRKFPVSSGAVAKLQPRGDLGTKQKKSGLHSKLGISSSQYKWKSSSLQSPPSTFASTFTWRHKGCDGAGVSPHVGASTSLQTLRRVPLGHGNPRPFFGNTGFYKLKSRTKIIKRKGNVCSPAEKRNAAFSTVVLKSRYTLRKKNSPRGRPSSTVRRSGTKGLVQIGKHRLRRLPTSRAHASAKEGKVRLEMYSFGYQNRMVETCFISSLTHLDQLSTIRQSNLRLRNMWGGQSTIPTLSQAPSALLADSFASLLVAVKQERSAFILVDCKTPEKSVSANREAGGLRDHLFPYDLSWPVV